MVFVQVITTLAGTLLGLKARLGKSEGVLPVAELTLSMFCKCPGLSRYGRERDGGREGKEIHHNVIEPSG